MTSPLFTETLPGSNLKSAVAATDATGVPSPLACPSPRAVGVGVAGVAVAAALV